MISIQIASRSVSPNNTMIRRKMRIVCLRYLRNLLDKPCRPSPKFNQNENRTIRAAPPPQVSMLVWLCYFDYVSASLMQLWIWRKEWRTPLWNRGKEWRTQLWNSEEEWRTQLWNCGQAWRTQLWNWGGGRGAGGKPNFEIGGRSGACIVEKGKQNVIKT